MILRYIVALLFLVNIVLGADVEVVESFAVTKKINIHKKYKYIKPFKHKKYPKIKKYKKRKHLIQKKFLRKKRVLRKRVAINIKEELQSYKDIKVVIIIDDISHKWQLQELRQLGFKVTPSIFPPNKMNMHTPLMAHGLKHFMVHLPLESHSKQMNSMYKTLFRSVSKKEIKDRVAEIRRLFPTAKFINNHTGSRFTQDYNASKVLYSALIKSGFNFVDSRTTQKTVFPRLAKEFHKRYLKSDQFIDNKLDINMIKKEIQKGLNIAKKEGKVVMIGHPHPQTFKALRSMRAKLQKFNLIYIDEL